jgi:hypothetical protein
MGNIIKTRKLPFGEDENPAKKSGGTYLTLEGAFCTPPPSASYSPSTTTVLLTSYPTQITRQLNNVAAKEQESVICDLLDQTRSCGPAQLFARIAQQDAPFSNRVAG